MTILRMKESAFLGMEFAAATRVFILLFIIGYYISITIDAHPYQTQLKACDILLKSLHFG